MFVNILNFFNPPSRVKFLPAFAPKVRCFDFYTRSLFLPGSPWGSEFGGRLFIEKCTHDFENIRVHRATGSTACDRLRKTVRQNLPLNRKVHGAVEIATYKNA
jgi:hypothetical protein